MTYTNVRCILIYAIAGDLEKNLYFDKNTELPRLYFGYNFRGSVIFFITASYIINI